MKRYLFFIAVAVCACQPKDACLCKGGLNDCLIYNVPAKIWEETLPLGNGRLGCMPYGEIENERVVLNDISMWAGSEADYANPEAAKSLNAIRQLLFEGKNNEAQDLMYKSFVPKSTGGNTYGCFQMLADLDMELTAPFDTVGYLRSLDMSQGIVGVTYQAQKAHYKREYFASRDIDVIVVRYETDGNAFDLLARLSRPERGEVSFDDGRLVLSGELDSGAKGVRGVRYVVLLDAVADNTDAIVEADTCGLHIVNAKSVTLYVSAATSLLYADKYWEYADSVLSVAKTKRYSDLRDSHVKAHSELYNRVDVSIKGNGDEVLTTDKRIERYAQSEDPAMAELYYNFGRYSLISSTRPGSLPPNLQGLWANECGTPWNGDYHTNINVQMNHWPLEQADLGELYEPLISLVEGNVPSGEKSAKTFYGNEARGWVMHMMTNVWNFTAPGEHPSWGATNTGGAWLCAHLWEHYEYTLDTLYLRRIYPVIKGAAEFFKSTMVIEPKHGWLVTAPTSSPENAFYVDGCDMPVSVCMGPTMDIQIVKELYTNVAKAADILGVDKEYAKSLRFDIESFPPMQIAKGGYLQEWLEDYREADIQHRHVSHLYGLHPSNQISPRQTPALAEACRVTLNRRGDGGTGWSRAWKINFWARLYDGDRAARLLKSLLTPAVDTLTKRHGSGTFPNLWCSHPPFQLDGNYGGAAGIGEMLLQSHEGFINPLPALPTTWDTGSVRGLKVRGGAKVSFSWTDGQIDEMTIEGGKRKEYIVALPKCMTSIKINGKDYEAEQKDTGCYVVVALD